MADLPESFRLGRALVGAGLCARQREKSATIRTSEVGRQEINNSNNSPRQGSAKG
jgi:hypothetical protein